MFDGILFQTRRPLYLKDCLVIYFTRGSPIFFVFLDASKAFDRVNHCLIFQIVRNVSM